MGSMAPVLAQLPARGLQLPPNYNTFQPPAVGGAYVDPANFAGKRRPPSPGTAS